MFRRAAQDWLDGRVGLAPDTLRAYRSYVATLTEEFGPRLVSDISADDVSSLQRARLGQGLGNRRINYEVGVLQQILRRHGCWSGLADQVGRLPERHDVGRAIDQHQEKALLKAAARSSSPALLPLLVLALDTGLRKSEETALRRSDLFLEWKDGVIQSGHLVVGRSKTKAGTGRVVPLTQRVCGALTL